MEIKIVDLPAFKVVGPAYHGKNENNEIAQMWQQFMPRFGEIENKVKQQIAYGICDELDADGAFTYVAGFAVTGEPETPDGMVAWDVPAQQYAIFPTTLQTIHETYAYVFQEWMPGSDYVRATGPDFEYYDEEFDASVAEPKLYIYIPVISEDVKVAV